MRRLPHGNTSFSNRLEGRFENTTATVLYRGSILLKLLVLGVTIKIIDSAGFVAKKIRKLGIPFFVFIGKFSRSLFLNSLLGLFFAILKLKRRIRKAIQSRRHKFVSLISAYIYKATIALIIIITISYNLLSNATNAEELQTSIPLNTLLSVAPETDTTLIAEGPLAAAPASGDDYFAQNLMATIYAPDTDDNNLYATDDTDGALAAPIIANETSGVVRDSMITYEVQPGDTIGTISQKFDVNINTILWQNNLSVTSTIRPGDSLSILPVDGIAHSVKSGETLGAIAKKYQADLDEIILQNKLADAGDIGIGEVIIVPNGIKPTAVVVAPAPRPKRTLPETVREIFVPSEPIDSDTKLLWPLNSSRITQYFHFRHSGLDVGDKKGNPIYAAEGGKIERSGWNSGYGYNIIINHGNGIKTLYGHSSQLMVDVGDTVARGDTIGLIGSTGWSTGPHLHFEVHVNGRKVNPLNYIR